MTDKTTNEHKADLIEQILDIELDWFLNVNPDITAECQRHPKAFKVMRRSNFTTWSSITISRYLEHLREAVSQQRNLVREKYAKMQDALPCENDSPAIDEIMRIHEGWQETVRRDYPVIFQPKQQSGFARYLRCELDTYSPAVLESYLSDVAKAAAEGRNLITETYDRLARDLGYESLDEWNRQRDSAQQQTG